jgi:hypothetical protein
MCAIWPKRDPPGGAEVLVIAPALMGRVAFWASDDSLARRAADARLRRCLESLRCAGIVAEGIVGDADPLLALADALAVFPADEVLIAAQAPHHAGWLERDLVTRARERFPGPIRHVLAAGERLTRVAAA